VRDPTNRKYILGPALIGLGRATRNSAELIRYVRPSLLELRKKYNETVNLGVLSRGKVIYLDTLESAQQLRVTVPMTIDNNAHTTALGKAILSFMPEESSLKRYGPQSLHRMKPRASEQYSMIQSGEQIALLDVICSRGYCVAPNAKRRWLLVPHLLECADMSAQGRHREGAAVIHSSKPTH
jgi:DNA-binding IclR family transcriptional regulator